MIPESIDGKNIVALYSASIDRDVSAVGIPASIEHIVSGLSAGKTMIYAVDQANPYYAEFNGAIYTKDLKSLVACPTAYTEFTIPDTVTSVGNRAFYNDELTVTVPASVTNLEVIDPLNAFPAKGGGITSKVYAFKVAEDNAYFSSNNGALTSKDGSTRHVTKAAAANVCIC